MAKSALEMLEELTKEEQKLNERREKLREQAAKEVEEAAIKHVGKLIELAEVSQAGVRSALKPLVESLGLAQRTVVRRGGSSPVDHVKPTDEQLKAVYKAIPEPEEKHLSPVEIAKAAGFAELVARASIKEIKRRFGDASFKTGGAGRGTTYRKSHPLIGDLK